MKNVMPFCCKHYHLFCSFILLVMVGCTGTNSTSLTPPQASVKPWAYSLDSTFVRQHPDHFAWQLFKSLNWPADTINMVPDTTRHFGDSGWVFWQTWKTVVEVYLPDGSKPMPWQTKTFGNRPPEYFSNFSLKSQLPDITKDPTYGIEEIAMSKSTFDYIVGKQLYNLNGQLAMYNADSVVKFPNDAVEVKVKWREIPDTPYEKARYHWQYIRVKDGKKTERLLYGMASMHITSRVLGNWLWATFEHIDSRSQKHPGDDGWLLTSKDQFACEVAPYSCEMAPANFGLAGTKWQYYRLRGTQFNYEDAVGKPTLLANSNIERGFQMSSSCITCHSLATIGPIDSTGNMQRINFVKSIMTEDGVLFGGEGYVGLPDTSLYIVKGGTLKRMDFVWSMSRANWYKPDSTSATLKTK